ncbi:unnamed protein product [Tetraodon nigroviridis]|uniref:(spotted green pufferfish) hypothetical protein n=1 Tax=Tetraodon nigroviridis TaxID=99883 RepID=Q4TGZ2_TETNG|nr:unnamed protein product [Tetraodon nigroviridis]
MRRSRASRPPPRRRAARRPTGGRACTRGSTGWCRRSASLPTVWSSPSQTRACE